MTTRNFVPRANKEGSIGTALKRWANGFFGVLNAEQIPLLDEHIAAQTAHAAAQISAPATGNLTTGTVASQLVELDTKKIPLAGIAANLKLFGKPSGTEAEWATGMKIGSFTRDTSLASGTQVITGVGFRPSLVIFLASINGTSAVSIGFDNGVNKFAIANIHEASATIWNNNSNRSIVLQRTGGNHVGNISTLGADGFTFDWTKVDTITGLATIIYLALR